jgi:dihydroorotate dehydrogenase (NAD+) catalytic subunit
VIAGATAVQVGTANFVDPLIWSKLLSGIDSYLERHEIQHLRDLVGALEGRKGHGPRIEAQKAEA